MEKENSAIDLDEMFFQSLNESDKDLEGIFKEIRKIYFQCFFEIHDFWNEKYLELFDTNLPTLILIHRSNKQLIEIFNEVKKEYLKAKAINGKEYSVNNVEIKSFKDFIEMDNYFNKNKAFSLICLNKEDIFMEILWDFKDFITCINDAFLKYKIKKSNKYKEILNLAIEERTYQKFINPDIDLNVSQILKKVLNEPFYKSNSSDPEYQTILKALKKIDSYEKERHDFQISKINMVLFQ